MSRTLPGANFEVGATIPGKANFNSRGAINTFQALSSFLQENRDRQILCGAASWTDTAVGSGSVPSSSQTHRNLRTGATANSSILTYTADPLGFNTAQDVPEKIDWRNPLTLEFEIYVSASDTQAVRRVQLKQVSSIGILADLGIGLQIDNLALTGESHDGTSRGTVDLATTLTAAKTYSITIKLLSTGVEFYVDNVLKGTITANFPATMGATNYTFMGSHANGAAGTNSDFIIISPRAAHKK